MMRWGTRSLECYPGTPYRWQELRTVQFYVFSLDAFVGYNHKSVSWEQAFAHGMQPFQVAALLVTRESCAQWKLLRSGYFLQVEVLLRKKKMVVEEHLQVESGGDWNIVNGEKAFSQITTGSKMHYKESSGPLDISWGFLLPLTGLLCSYPQPGTSLTCTSF